MDGMSRYTHTPIHIHRQHMQSVMRRAMCNKGIYPVLADARPVEWNREECCKNASFLLLHEYVLGLEWNGPWERRKRGLLHSFIFSISSAEEVTLSPIHPSESPKKIREMKWTKWAIYYRHQNDDEEEATVDTRFKKWIDLFFHFSSSSHHQHQHHHGKAKQSTTTFGSGRKF